MSRLDSVIRFCKDDTGATAVEYSLMASLICGAIVVAVTLLSDTVDGMWTDASQTLVTAILAAKP